ncbi:MAG: Na+/H+ antiporter subunit E [Planctomycetes bacterium]|nr:Na+/H+ antiporter subunit E [Planctomycetota bacterium]MCB9918525.1 Na+/H+ antiporter subunit E [Planctomycetota bacterium]
MMRSLMVFLMLAVTWVVLSGYFTKLLLGFGLASCILVTLLARRMDHYDGDDIHYKLGLRPLTYLPYLMSEIVKSNLHIARVVLSRHMPVHQQLVRVRASQESELAQVVYGDSITLTPGTTTLDIRDGVLLVHALTKEAAAGLLSGEMDRRCAALEGPTSMSNSESNSGSREDV